MYDILELNSKVLVELREIAHSIRVPHVQIMKKPDLIFMILNQQPVTKTQPNLNQILFFS